MIGMHAVAGALDPPITDQAETVEAVWGLFLWIAIGVVALVFGLIGYVIIRFRRRNDEMPAQKHYNIPMEITYVVIPFLVVVGLFGITFATEQNIGDSGNEPDLVIDVVAFQWQWQFTYPEAGVSVIGGADSDIPTLVLPASSTVRFDMESLDVIHSFWITAFRFKRDIIPGTPASFDVDINDAVGDYPNAGVCAEYCGLDHAKMQFSVRVLAPDDFEQWLADQQSDAGADEPLPAPVEETADSSTDSPADSIVGGA